MPETLSAEPVSELYCSFWLEGRWFGVPAHCVREVHAPVAITPIPGAPRTVVGYVNLRGQLFLVLDPCELLAGCCGDDTSDAHLVVFKSTAGEAFAIQAGRVGEIVAVRPDQVDVPKPLAEGPRYDGDDLDGSTVVVGHAKMDSGLLMLIDPKRLLPAVFAGYRML